MHRPNTKGIRQRSFGYIMLMVMVVLAALGLSAVSVMEQSTLAEKQASNDQQQQRVQQVSVSEVLN